MENDNNSINLEKLISPPPEFSPAYFWSWNDVLDEKKLMDQLHDMYHQGLRAVCIHPMPPEFRPTTMATLMEPAYLSEEYFRIIRKLVDECSRLNMHFYLYDEAAWPSGSAAGRVLACNPDKFVRKYVRHKEICLDDGEKYVVPSEALCLSITLKDKTKKLYYPGESLTGEKMITEINLFSIEKEVTDPNVYPGKPDLLCPEATHKFIDLTHEAYNKAIGDTFGKQVKFAFTDEPAVPSTRLTYEGKRRGPYQLTWTDDLIDEFKTRKGYDLVPHIPSLFDEHRNNETIKVILDFYDVWSSLFAERYFRPLKEWCRKNNLLSGGHLGGEDEPLLNAYAGFGHIFKALRELDLPGIDAIWRQIYPGNQETVIFPKYAQSITRQSPGPDLVLSETFMVYGNGLTPTEMKWIADQQLVLGVNVFVFGHYLYSTREHFMPFARPYFGPINPLWKHMRHLHDYVAKISYLMSLGHSDCSVAVYYPIRDIWAGPPYRQKAIETHNEIAKNLLENQVDFDYIDDEVLIQKNINNGKLIVWKASYSVIIVPDISWMKLESLEALKIFENDKGKIIIVNSPPRTNGVKENSDGLAGLNAATSNAVDLYTYVNPTVNIEPRNKDIRICKRVCTDENIYFLTNGRYEEVKVNVTFPDQDMVPLLCDVENGLCSNLKTKSGKTKQIELSFEPYGSLIVIFTKNPNKLNPSDTYEIKHFSEIMNLDSGWKLKPVKQFTVGENDYIINDLPDPNPKDCDLGDWKNVLGIEFSGEAEYSINFEYQMPEEHIEIFLDLGDVKYVAEIKLNGTNLGPIIWPPFRIDVTDFLVKGTNELKVIITNTLANAILTEGVQEHWQNNLGNKWPQIDFAYNDRQLEFEKDSLPSGLFGPVKLLKIQ